MGCAAFRLLGAALLVFLTPFADAKPKPPLDLKGALFAARHALKINKPDRAQEYFKLVLKADPGHEEARLNLGLALFEAGRWDEAEAALEKAARQFPARPEPRQNLGLLRLRQSRPEEALTQLRLAKQLGSAEPELFLMMARLELEAGRPQAALELLGREKSAAHEALRAACLHSQGKLPEAEIRLRKALALAPRQEALKRDLGVLLLDQGRPAEALREFQKAGDLEGQAASKLAMAELELARGGEAMMDGDAPAARRSWEKALEMDPGNAAALEALRRLKEGGESRAQELAKAGEEALALQDAETAKEAFEEALWLSPGLYAAKKGLGKAKWMIQKSGQASAAAKSRALKRKQAKEAASQAAFDQASAACKTALVNQNWRAALRAAERGLRLKPSDAELAASARLARGKIASAKAALMAEAVAHERGGKKQEALDRYAKVLDLDPGQAQARQRQAVLQRELHGQAEKARDTAELSKLYYEGVYAYAEGETTLALAAWKKALTLDPRHGPTLSAMEEAQAKLAAIKKLGKKS